MARTLVVGGRRLAQYLAVAALPLQLKHVLSLLNEPNQAKQTIKTK
jgi:hypothetical protein